MIGIDFEFHSQYGVFRDCLWLPEDHGYTDEELLAMQRQRFDNWVAVITAPAPPEEIPADPPAVDTPPADPPPEG